jgi:hypothetical protein
MNKGRLLIVRKNANHLILGTKTQSSREQNTELLFVHIEHLPRVSGEIKKYR